MRVYYDLIEALRDILGMQNVSFLTLRLSNSDWNSDVEHGEENTDIIQYFASMPVSSLLISSMLRPSNHPSPSIQSQRRGDVIFPGKLRFFKDIFTSSHSFP